MKRSILLLLIGLVLSTFVSGQTGLGSRMNEVFLRTDLAYGTSGAQRKMRDPWEITYGLDGALWITEARTYKVTRMDPNTGAKNVVLSISDTSTFTPSAFKRVFNINQANWPQGGMMGLALHPDFMATVPKKYVYVAYVHDYVGQNVTYNGEFISGHLYRTWLVRFTYSGGQLISPVALCDTIRGSNDHNSGRMIIKKDNGIPYLYYAIGDLGAGQFDNLLRTNKAQDSVSYEGKILRFNLEDDGDVSGQDKWIPNDNPFNNKIPGKQSAIWVNGIRNNQGFAYDAQRDILYGSSHGPFSDDEINIIEKGMNYGHPRIIGYSWDHNYDSAKAGPIGSNLPYIGNEAKYASDTIGAGYRDPIYSFYAAPRGDYFNPSSIPNSVQYIYKNIAGSQNANGAWFSDGISGMDIYTSSIIPGWKNSLLIGNLKGGKITRMKLTPVGDSVVKTAPYDTIGLFRSQNRFRDIAFSPDGRTIFVVIDSSATTSGPTTGNPIISACGGCVQKYTFLGYNDNGTTSTLPDHIPVATGQSNVCDSGNIITINTANSNNAAGLWVPITDTSGNIIAEIYPNTNDLGAVRASVFIYPTDANEFTSGNKNLFLKRSINITVANQPAGGKPVRVRLYLTSTELNLLKAAVNSMGVSSGVTSINDVSIYKSSTNTCATMTANPALLATITSLPARTASNSYVLQANNITSFSTFYVASSLLTLPLNLLTFKGALTNDVAQLQWLTENENGTKSYIVERSVDGKNFDSLGFISAKNIAGKFTYYFNDANVRSLSSPVIYYRLRLTDIDGQYHYSTTIKVNVSYITGTISVRPNPIVSETVLDVFAATDEKANWTLTDINGKTIRQQAIQLRKGDNSFNINLSNLPAGMYYLKVNSNTINQAVKVQKL